jgi:ABC-2 type transport system ATP-binding protein
MSVPALRIRNLRKVYRRGNVAVKDLSLTIHEGDFFGFLGPNGAGKSTTIHCVTGIAEPTGGSIEIFGVDAVKNYREARRLIGLCTQEFNVDPFATPRQIVDWMGGYFGMGRVARKARVDDLLERFELTAHEKKAFRELSGGLKRRVMLARALVNDPRLLILDEPTAGVDVELRRVLWRYLRQINGGGHTILLTSHYLEEVERLCRDIAIVNHGLIVRQGTKDEIAGAPGGLEDAYLAATGAVAERAAGE